MQTIGRLAAILAAAGCVLAMPARADDAVYVGTATVTKGGTSAACSTRRLKIAVTGDRFNFGGTDSAPIASGAVKPDGTFATTYTSLGRISVQVDLEGRISGNEDIGTMSSASGCVQSFTLTKQ